MNKTVLSRLDRSINRVNRFISTSIPFNKTYREYEKVFHSVELVTEKNILEVSRILIRSAVPKFIYKKAKSFDEVKTAIEKIFSDKKILLGEKNITYETVSKISIDLEKIYRKKQKLVFTLLGYPHKTPNPLYTNSTSIDLSEIISLFKLYRLMRVLNEIYPYGVRLLILTENSIFHKMSDIPYEEQLRYFNDLCYWEKLIDEKQFIEVRDIKDYHTDELEQRWRKLEIEIKNKYEVGDPVVKEKVDAVMPTNFMTLNYRQYRPETLIKFFDLEYKNRQIEALRGLYYKRALKESFYYLSYHQARYELGFMDTSFPNAFRLTVAPKVGSFAINMLNEESKILPYYGYVVKNGKRFKIEYLIDVPEKAKSVYWDSNLEYPFYYEV